MTLREWIASGMAATALTDNAPAFRMALLARARILDGARVETLGDIERLLPRRDAHRVSRIADAFEEWRALVGCELDRPARDVIAASEAAHARAAGGGIRASAAVSEGLARAGRASMEAERRGDAARGASEGERIAEGAAREGVGLDSRGAAKFLGIPTVWMVEFRREGIGPAFTRVAAGAIRYAPEELQRFRDSPEGQEAIGARDAQRRDRMLIGARSRLGRPHQAK